MTSDLKLIFFLNTSWGATPLCKVSSSRSQRLIFKKILNFRSFRFLAPKKSNFTEIFIFKNCILKTLDVLYFCQNPKSLTRREVFFKNSRKSPIQLTLWNQRPAIQLPIGVHYHIVTDICCVDTDFGSTHQRSHICGQRFCCKKI